MDSNGSPYQLFNPLKVNKQIVGPSGKLKVSGPNLNIFMQFQGHYNEPCLTVDIPLILLEAQMQNELDVNMIFNPFSRKWEIVMTYDPITKDPLMPLEFK